MKGRLVRFFSSSYIMLSLLFLNVGCSGSGSNDEQPAEVAASEEGGEAANSNEGNEGEGQADNNENEGNNAEGNALANSAEINDQGAVGAENNSFGSNGLNSNGNAVADNNDGQAGGEEDLQQIIEEMNTANNQLPNQAAPGIEDASNFASGGMDNATSTAGGNSADGGAASVGTPTGPGLPELGSKMTYIVQKGDTLAKIAQKVYGEGNKWTEIANFTGLANPRLIYPGDVVYYQLNEQSMKFSSAYEGIQRSEVQIQQGDTLTTIAGRVFGNSSLWKLIWRQNDRIDNPDSLTVGTTIYYVDPQRMASLEQPKDQTIVKSSILPTSKIVTAKIKQLKPALYEVANDHLDDILTNQESKDLLKRS